MCYFEELLQPRSGVKIRLKTWDKEKYIFWYNDSGCWLDNNGNGCSPKFDFDSDDWELYVEPKQKKKIKIRAYCYGSGSPVRFLWPNQTEAGIAILLPNLDQEIEVEE